MYRLIRPLLFRIDAEKIHHLIFKILALAGKVPGFKVLLKVFFVKRDSRLQRNLLGLRFENPVGLAAGFDKDAKIVDELACLGFGFIEIGTVTPRAQPGNDKPRLFRLPADEALINRMGFNNEGVLKTTERLMKKKSGVIVGGNIGKNKATPNENALDDYTYCFQILYPYVDYFVVNVSSPNTPGLRELQEREPLRKLLHAMKELSMSKATPKPVLLKIAPDLTPQQLDDVVSILSETGTDGVIATNTTISREGLSTPSEILEKIGSGGLSGKPLKMRSAEVIRYLRTRLGKDFPIIGVGGIMTPQDALEMLHAGANLIQVYSGLVYNGPGFVGKINRAILNSGV